MCQLTFANLHNKNLNRLFSLVQTRINAKTNKDGFGLFTEDRGIGKTIYSASNLIDGGRFVRDCIQSDKPVLLHVRAASKGIPIEVANVHPFETKDFVLAHNGTLYGKDEKVVYNYTAWDKDENRASDSLMFLMSLQSAYKGDVVAALQEAMKLYKGKFAFLIFHKDTKQYFAVRGRTAELHIGYVEDFGYVINTQKVSLEEGLAEVSNLWQLGEKGEAMLKYKIEELSKESIFLCTKTGVEKIGEIKETDTYTSNFTAATTAVQKALPTITMGRGDNKTNPKSGSFEDWVDTIRDGVSDNAMSFDDLCTLIELVNGVPLHRMIDDDVKTLAEKVFPQLEPQAKVRKYLARHFTSRHLSASFFSEYKLQFPIGANRAVTSSTLIRYLKMYMEKN